VSDVLVKGGIVDPRFFTELGRVRGTAVHEAVYLHIQNDLCFETLHAVVRPYVEAYLSFEELTGFKPILAFCEKRLINPFYYYTGRLDLLGWLNGKLVVIDLKSGYSKAARYQTAAYSQFPEIIALGHPIYRFDLQLTDKGKFKLNPHVDPNDWLIFLNALKAAREVALRESA